MSAWFHRQPRFGGTSSAAIVMRSLSLDVVASLRLKKYLCKTRGMLVSRKVAALSYAKQATAPAV